MRVLNGKASRCESKSHAQNDISKRCVAKHRFVKFQSCSVYFTNYRTRIEHEFLFLFSRVEGEGVVYRDTRSVIAHPIIPRLIRTVITYLRAVFTACVHVDPRGWNIIHPQERKRGD